MRTVFGCPVEGLPVKLVLLAAAASLAVWQTGYGPALLLGLPSVCIAHEVGHCRAALKAGIHARIKMSTWLPVTVVAAKPVPRKVAAAGVCCSLKLGLGALVSIAVMVSLAASADSVLGSNALSSWTTAASSTLIGTAAISVLDAIINWVPSVVSSAVVAAVAASGGFWFVAIAACAFLAFSMMFRPINDGDLLCGHTGLLAHGGNAEPGGMCRRTTTGG